MGPNGAFLLNRGNHSLRLLIIDYYRKERRDLVEASVKVQSTASVRTSAAGRLPSVDTSAGGSGCRQRLQVKKDAADVKGQNQTDKSGKPDSINQTDKKTSESDEAGKASESKKDETKVPDTTDSEDAACQEALQRAALEQAAAQMVGMVQDRKSVV